MKNNKGQALIEFILILPVFLMIILGIIDFGKIFYTKYTMQNDLDVIADLYKNNKIDEYNNYAANNDLNLQISSNIELTTIKITKNIDIMTPGLDKILGNPYLIEESMIVSNE
ncbi:MAG: pilus assembly protein [Bacilli bacterium]|nr:pilus assembly protein [Bacilli bacterium]